MNAKTGPRYSLSARVSEFDIPPVTDGVVIGTHSPIGFSAISKAMDLLGGNHFQTIELEDDTISHVIVRRTIMRRLPEDRLVAFILERVKPLMCQQEIVHLELDVKVAIEESEL